MMATMSTRIGLISGPGVKFNRPAPTPPTNIAVRMPRVVPSESIVITIAFAGSTTDPNTSAMSRNVATMM